MSLLDRLREAQDEPARHRSSPWTGPSILSVAQLRAMERVLAREMPDGTADPVPDLAPEPLPVWSPPLRSAPQDELPVGLVPLPESTATEPLPLWTPPVFERAPARARVMVFDPCPNCGEDAAIDRIDLTLNASWLSCRACGLRWGGSVDRAPSGSTPLLPALPEPSEPIGERGQIAVG